MVASNKFIFIFLTLPSLLYAQLNDSTQVNKKRLHGFVIGSTIAYSATLVGLNQLWYKDAQKTSFHFFNDNGEWKQLDKAGHFYSAFYFSYGTANALKWCNVPPKKSDLLGAITGFAILVPIEIFDGFSADYGASPGDLIADAAGATFYLGQSLLWKEIRIHPKFSFHRTDYASLRPEALGEGMPSEMLKDYNGQTYWLSVDMDKFMKFPKWLNLAAGYGAEGMVYGRDEQNIEAGYPPAYRQYYLSIDFDLTAIKTRSKFLKTLIFVANMIKLPAPAVEFSKKGTKFHPFYF